MPLAIKHLYMLCQYTVICHLLYHVIIHNHSCKDIRDCSEIITGNGVFSIFVGCIPIKIGKVCVGPMQRIGKIWVPPLTT